MKLRTLLACACLPLAIGLAACGKREVDPSALVEVSMRDTDPAFLSAALQEDISTRESPKPEARFVLSEVGITSSRYSSRYSLVISKADGCNYRFDYSGRDKPSYDPKDIKGIPFAAVNSLSMTGDEAPFKIQASGSICAAKAQRADLVQARGVAGGRASSTLDLGKKFAQAVPSMAEAMKNRAAPDPNSRFVMIATTSGKADEVAFLERSTGCQWNATLANGLLRAKSIEPADCMAIAYSPGFQDGKPAAAAPASAASGAKAAP